jgi:regulator of protease activity HflC (stomatin/prohibitin superfamily)
MADGALLPVLIPAALLVAILLVLSYRRTASTVIHAWQRGVLYRDGTFVRILPPGRHRLWFGRTVQTVAVNPQTILVPPQEALTADRFLVKLPAVVTFQVEPESARAVLEADSLPIPERVRLRVQLALRDLVAARTLDALLDARPTLDAELRALLAAPTLPPALAGIAIRDAAVRDIILAAEIRRMFTDIERARREGLASLERARGEQAALRALANAARMLKGNPELMNLRLLQALQPAQGRGAPTVVLGGGAGLLPVQPGAGEPELPPEG